MKYKQLISLFTKLFIFYGLLAISSTLIILYSAHERNALPLDGINIHWPSKTALPSSESARNNSLALKVESGDTLLNILLEANIDKTDAVNVISQLEEVYNPEKLHIGQKLSLTYDMADTTAAEEEVHSPFKLQTLRLMADAEHEILITRAKGDQFSIKETFIPLQKHIVRTGGTIDATLLGSANDQGISTNIMLDIIKAFSYDVDFQRDIQSGDKFDVVYERLYNKSGEYVRDGSIIYASLILGGRTLNIYRHTNNRGETDFYAEDGRSVRKDLLRTPLSVAHVSSKFGMRKHPVLGYSKMHKGVDFSASIGTPIFAAGSGTIEEIGRKGSYGNYIRLRHNGEYSTAYGHISRFLKGLRRGDSVKQGDVIAYVGSTGRATGPHLHFEVLEYGQQIDPLKVKVTPAQRLAGTELANFLQKQQKLREFLAANPASVEMAAGNNSPANRAN